MKGNVKETLLFWLAILSGLFSIASFFVALSSDSCRITRAMNMSLQTR